MARGRGGGAVPSVAEGSGSPTLRLTEPFEVFYEREFPSVVGLAYALSGNRSGAEDLAQEAFLAAHRDWDRVGPLDKPGAWVRRVVANMSVSLFRRTALEARSIARLAARRQEALPELSAEDADFWAAVRSLPKRQAQAVTLYYLEDLPVTDIAEILDCAEGTVKAHLHAGRRSLAKRLGLEGEERG